MPRAITASGFIPLIVLHITMDKKRFFHQEFGWHCTPCSINRTVYSLLLSAHIIYHGLRRKMYSINSKKSRYGFKTHRHQQIWEKMGLFESLLWLRAVSNELSMYFKNLFIFAERFDFLWLFPKILCYQNMAHYIQWNLHEQCTLSMLILPTQILSSSKGKKPLTSSFIMFSVLLAVYRRSLTPLLRPDLNQ